MWIKALKYLFIAAKATGLDKKVKDWVKGKLHKAEEKAINVAGKKLQAIEDAMSTVEPERED